VCHSDSLFEGGIVHDLKKLTFHYLKELHESLKYSRVARNFVLVKTKTSINALVELMDDPDERIALEVENKLREHGVELLPMLERLFEESLDNPVKAERLDRLLKQLQFEELCNNFKNWLSSVDKNLLEGVFYVCKFQYPHLTVEELQMEFLKLKEAVWLEINPKQTSFEHVKVLNRVFFDHFDFKRSASFPVSPFDLFANTVFETREGSDLALGLIYSIVAQELDIPIYSVTSYKHTDPFLLAYIDRHDMLSLLDWGIDNNGVLFYISVANKGVIVDPQRLKKIYTERGLEHQRALFEPAANTQIIKKYLLELKRVCGNNAQFRYKMDDLSLLIQIFDRYGASNS